MARSSGRQPVQVIEVDADLRAVELRIAVALDSAERP
jgi:hypothetical protein